MALDIDKHEMDQAWIDRNKSDKLYKYLYEIAKYQVSKKGISFHERSDYVQFALLKCFKHQDSFKIQKGAAYSFFWKQISLAILYKSRKEARRNDKVKTVYVEQEKILDWIENAHIAEMGENFRDIVDEEEVGILKKAYKKYNAAHKGQALKPDKDSIIIILKWAEANEPGFLDKFSTLKSVFKNWANI